MPNQQILVITENAQIGHQLANVILRPAGYRVSLVKDAWSAEVSFRAFPPDLVILDAPLEGEFGPQLTKKLIAERPTVPILLASSEERLTALDIALDWGAVDVVSPLGGARHVLTIVQRTLKNRSHFGEWLNRHFSKNAVSLRRRLDVLETLQQIGQSVSASLDLDEVLTKVVEAAVSMTGAEEGSLLIVDEESGDLYMRAARNFQDDFVHTFRLPIDDTLAGEVVRTGRAVVLDEDTPQKIKTAYLVRALMYVPLKTHGRVVGVLGVDNRTRSQPFHEQHLTVMAALADYAAIAIENARLFHEIDVERQKLASILTGIGDGVIVVDESYRVILVNSVAREAFNIPPDIDVTDQRVDQVFHHEQLLELFTDTPPSFPYHCELTVDDGRVMNTQLVKIPDIGLGLTMQDITALKELDRVKSDFVHTVSHDLRSPLTAILGYVELLNRVGPLNEQQTMFVQRVQVSVRNITDLINDLLELGRIEAGFDARKEFVPLPSIVQYALDGFKNSIAEKEYRMVVDLPTETPEVFGDPNRLRQLVEKLLSNAIQYTPRGGEIRVALKSEIDQVILQVQDTGVGIPAADQPYIFDKFYRASNIDADIPGSGLGLAIVKSIVENHQGRVWVDSIPEQGSTFTVVFPVADNSL